MLSGAVGAIIGAVIGGLFVVWAVQLQFKRQSEAACRALKVEIEGNLEAISQMIGDRPALQYPDGHADPGWLKRGTWDSQSEHWDYRARRGVNRVRTILRARKKGKERETEEGNT